MLLLRKLGQCQLRPLTDLTLPGTVGLSSTWLDGKDESKTSGDYRLNVFSVILGWGILHCGAVNANPSLRLKVNDSPLAEITEIRSAPKPTDKFDFLNGPHSLEGGSELGQFELAQVSGTGEQLQVQVPMEPDPLESDLRDLGITDVTPIDSVPNYQNNQLILETPDSSESDVTDPETTESSEDLPVDESDSESESGNTPSVSNLDTELGNLRLRIPSSSFTDDELGILRLQEIEELPIEPVAEPPVYRTGFITGRTSFFGGTNLFRAPIPLDDRVFQGGAGFYLFPRISEETSVLAGVEGNLVRYSSFPNISYNELQLQVGLRQRLTKKMSAQVSWRNQQLYTLGGESFFSADYAELLVSRRDILGPKVWLDSYYKCCCCGN